MRFKSGKLIICCLAASLLVSFGFGIFVSLWNSSAKSSEILSNGIRGSINADNEVHVKSALDGVPMESTNDGYTDKTLAVIVPFRDRFDELLTFVPYMDHFLTKQGIKHSINVINQANTLRFNRGSLINAGFLLVRSNCDYIAMHDVDLLPRNAELKYSYPEHGPLHLSSPELHPKYNYGSFFGGIVLIKNEDFDKVNGLSNRYWGWGQEDDEFYMRVKEAKLPIARPSNVTTNKTNSFWHIHDASKRKRDTAKLFNQREVTRRRDKVTGLNNVRYKLIRTDNLTINQASVTVYNVNLYCDLSETPWCRFKNVKGNKSTKKPNS